MAWLLEPAFTSALSPWLEFGAEPTKHEQGQPSRSTALVISKSLFKQTHSSNLVNRVLDRITSKVKFYQLVMKPLAKLIICAILLPTKGDIID